MAKRPPSPALREIPLGLLDEPENPSRETMDGDGLAELAGSMAIAGVIEPLIVTPRGDRFVVIAGHRRLLAANMANLASVPCVVRTEDAATLAALQEHENAFREDVNAAEQAAHYARLLTVFCGDDVDRLCALVKRKREYVENRLLLLAGDAAVYDALKARQITYSVAAELNLVRDDGTRAMYLDAARKGGASTRLVREWRQRSEQLAALQAGEIVPALEAHAPPPQPAGSSLSCVLCDSNEDVYEMDLVYMHRSCRRVLFDRWLRSVRRDQADAGAAAKEG